MINDVLIEDLSEYIWDYNDSQIGEIQLRIMIEKWRELQTDNTLDNNMIKGWIQLYPRSTWIMGLLF